MSFEPREYLRHILVELDYLIDCSQISAILAAKTHRGGQPGDETN